jgi:hypothetical protein
VGKSPWLARAGRFFDPERHDPASFEEQAAELQMPTPLGEAAQMRNPVLSDLCREHRAKTQAADVMASIVAERIVSSLEAANFVVRCSLTHLKTEGTTDLAQAPQPIPDVYLILAPKTARR